MYRCRYIDRYKCLPQKVELTYVDIQVLRTNNPTLSGSASVYLQVLYILLWFLLFSVIDSHFCFYSM